MGQFEVVAYHILGQDNRVPDILSRIHTGPEYRKKFDQVKQYDWKQIHIQLDDLLIHEIW